VTHRERVLRTFEFEETDRPAYDLMESCLWPELVEYFAEEHGVSEQEAILDFLDTDFRWVGVGYEGPTPEPPAEGLPEGWGGTYSDGLYKRRLAHAETVADVAWLDAPLLLRLRCVRDGERAHQDGDRAGCLRGLRCAAA